MRTENKIYRAQRYAKRWRLCRSGFDPRSLKVKHLVYYKDEDAYHFVEEKEIEDKSPHEIAKYLDEYKF